MNMLQVLATAHTLTQASPGVGAWELFIVLAPAALIAVVVVASAVKGDVTNRSRLVVIFGLIFLLAFFVNVQARAS
jgi:hypothetical protein